jgi:hypothetical protein
MVGVDTKIGRHLRALTHVTPQSVARRARQSNMLIVDVLDRQPTKGSTRGR